MSATVLITGANRGIGLALTQAYLADGCTVYAVCREASAALQASKAIIIDGVDMLHEQSYQNIFQTLGAEKLDLLINNAGIFLHESLGQMDYDGVIKQFQVNALAPLKITLALLDSLAANAKVAMITSRMGSMADNGSGSYYGYRMSKAALNAASVSLARDLAPKGIAVAILHPGFVQTDMVGGAGDIDPATSAARLKQRIAETNLSNTAQFRHSNGDALPW